MKVSELYDYLTKEKETTHTRDWDEISVVIKESISSVGSLAVVGVDHVHFGIDWDSEKFILTPSIAMTIKGRKE